MSSINIESDTDDEYLEEMLRKTRKAKKIRKRANNFNDWNDEEFFIRFRIMKQTALTILDEINEELEYTSDRNMSLPPMEQLLLTLRYYATGGMLTSVGDFCGIHKTTAGKIIKRVSRALVFLRPKYIKMPKTPVEVRQVQHDFYKIAAFPRVIGSLDCTHVRIASPGGNSAEEYRNRKGYFSLNVQTISDSKLRIRDIVVRWPGAVHDTTIFNSSVIRARLERGDMGSSVLVCDSGYSPKSYLLPPLRNPNLPEEHLFNEALIRTRNTVERQYGVWKRRFPCLSLGIRLKITTAQLVIVACAILHNIALEMGEGEPPVEPELLRRLNEVMQDEVEDLQNNEEGAEVTRQAFIDYFRGLIS